MSAGKFRRPLLFSSLAVVAVGIMTVMALAAMGRTTAALVNPPDDASVSATALGRRELHLLPYAHTHIYRTQTPTISPDEYYTDPGAINATMMREKKDMYQQDGNGNNDNGETNQLSNEASALESEQTVRSSATTNIRRRQPMLNLLFIGGINTILAWSLHFW